MRLYLTPQADGASRHGVASCQVSKENDLRKIVTGLVLLAFMALWIFAAGTIGTHMTGLNGFVQLAFYIFSGIAWVFPLRPLLRWMNSRDTPPDQS